MTLILLVDLVIFKILGMQVPICVYRNRYFVFWDICTVLIQNISKSILIGDDADDEESTNKDKHERSELTTFACFSAQLYRKIQAFSRPFIIHITVEGKERQCI